MRPVFRLCGVSDLFLASASPRRQQFLAELGLPYQVLTNPSCELSPEPGEDPRLFTARAAEQKARQTVPLIPESCQIPLLIAADTVVSIDGSILGKPANSAHALAMLSRLSGRSHQVTTSVCVILPRKRQESSFAFSDQSSVTFYDWPQETLSAYAQSEEPLDKAGAYAIQGQGAFLVKAIQGSWSTVVGLPLSRLCHELLERKLIA
ncbi:MAG: Maf family nucleotide pyrophosphatase [Desulfovibrio sp.]|nr:Maf family nucleotide pyrophosphatase [Desulfovibrio sp.]